MTLFSPGGMVVIPLLIQESVWRLKKSSRDLTIKNEPILQYGAVFDRSNPGAFSKREIRFLNKKRYIPAGILAFDIDGTLVRNNNPLSNRLVTFLSSLHEQGWILLFATGRTASWSMRTLSSLSFPYFLSPYNGALLLSMPEKTEIKSFFLSWFDVMTLSPYIKQSGALIYEGGGEERIFYTPALFSQPLLDHLAKRRTMQQEEWQTLEVLENLPDIPIASVRFFLSPSAALALSLAIQKQNATFHSPTMKDSVDDRIHIVQVTAAGATKGHALIRLRAQYPQLAAIAAGDDVNDLDLLEAADVKVAMADAPEMVLKIADIIAPSAAIDPIIPAIEKAIRRV